MKVLPCPCCGAQISAALINNADRRSRALELSDRDERHRALASITGETVLCPKGGRR